MLCCSHPAALRPAHLFSHLAMWMDESSLTGEVGEDVALSTLWGEGGRGWSCSHGNHQRHRGHTPLCKQKAWEPVSSTALDHSDEPRRKQIHTRQKPSLHSHVHAANALLVLLLRSFTYTYTKTGTNTFTCRHFNTPADVLMQWAYHVSGQCVKQGLKLRRENGILVTLTVACLLPPDGLVLLILNFPTSVSRMVPFPNFDVWREHQLKPLTRVCMLLCVILTPHGSVIG